MNGTDLLAEFRNGRAEDAFGELVRRYTNLVYSVAKRRLSNGSAAEEITQTVFIRLAKAAPQLRGDAELVAWLHRTTVHASIDFWRSEIRRRNREEHAAAMQTQPTQDAAWNDISPLLDEALNQLNDGERQVILLRFFEQRTMRDLGLALGISEDAAKMRVGRAMEHLRSLFSERGVACGVVGLGALLNHRAVEAAPAGLILALASLRIAAPIAPAAGSALAPWLAHLSKLKLVSGLAFLGAGVATLWLVSAKNSGRVPTTGMEPSTARTVALDRGGAAVTSASTGTNPVVAGTPDPIKLLQAVSRARNRIASGEFEFDVAIYNFDRAFDGTNHLRLKMLFDGNKHRCESFAREYSYTSTTPDADKVTDDRRRAEGLDREAAVRAGLLAGFDSHQVAVYDGAVLMDYCENDGRPVQAKIIDPTQGGGTYAFDPRCLGITISARTGDTIENCLACADGVIPQLVGEEVAEGVSSWHIRLRGSFMPKDFWLDAAHPVRVVKFTSNGSEVISKYDDANPRDPIPCEIRTMFLHGTTGTQTAFEYSCFTRRTARFEVQVDPVSWTLAGLGMKVGTDVVDYRLSRSLGYWTGAGLSENLPAKTAKPHTPPDRAELLVVLEHEPDSPAALQVAEWLLLNTPDGPEVEKAAEVILREHIHDTNLVFLCRQLERLRHRCSTKLLEAMLQKNGSTEVRANACLALARLHKDEAKYGQNRQATAEAVKLFERVSAEFGKVREGSTPFSELAKSELYELRRLNIGQTAPHTEGDDLEGRHISLDDYRGQVVLLVFWGRCGGCRPEVPPLLKLIERMRGKRFAVLGAYCDDDLDEGKAIAEKSGMTWPSFYDGEGGSVSAAWNNHSWPNYQIVDAKGIIRYREPSEGNLTKPIEALLRE